MSRARRILCLHGFRGSGAGLRSQMRPLLAGLEPELEFVYADAPALSSGGAGWWDAVPIEPSAEGEPALGTRARRYEGWQRTRDWAVSFFAHNWPIDGVFGFSQGAALSALLVGLRSPSGAATPDRPLNFDFAILVGGFKSNDPSHAVLYESPRSFELPSLHLIGRADRIVPREASLALAACFARPLVVEHDGGHLIPSSADARRALAELVAR